MKSVLGSILQVQNCMTFSKDKQSSSGPVVVYHTANHQ